MMWERNRAETERRLEQLLGVALPVLLTAAGVAYVWRLNQARHVRTRARLYVTEMRCGLCLGSESQQENVYSPERLEAIEITH